MKICRFDLRRCKDKLPLCQDHRWIWCIQRLGKEGHHCSRSCWKLQHNPLAVAQRERFLFQMLDGKLPQELQLCCTVPKKIIRHIVLLLHQEISPGKLRRYWCPNHSLYLNVQQDPHPPWSLTGLTIPSSLQSFCNYTIGGLRTKLKKKKKGMQLNTNS